MTFVPQPGVLNTCIIQSKPTQDSIVSHFVLLFIFFIANVKLIWLTVWMTLAAMHITVPHIWRLLPHAAFDEIAGQ